MPTDILTEVHRDKYTKLYFHLFCMVVKLGLSHTEEGTRAEGVWE